MEEKGKLTIEEIFCGIPNLLKSFQMQEEKIMNFKARVCFFVM